MECVYNYNGKEIQDIIALSREFFSQTKVLSNEAAIYSSDEIKKMSDSELRSKINRLQMEKQYKQLTSSEISVGRKFVQDVLTNAAKQTATNYVSKYMTKGIDAAIKKATGK